MSSSVFTLKDQNAFAQLSGDNNPLHIDTVAARRTLYGAPVVHGIHGVLRALEFWLKDKTTSVELSAIRVVFTRPIKVGEEFHFLVVLDEDNEAKIHIIANNAIATKIQLSWLEASPLNTSPLSTDFPRMIEPRALSEEDIETDAGELDLSLNIEAANKLFPGLVNRLSVLQISTIVHTSRLVGVHCPGLHSLFSEIELSQSEETARSQLHYKVEKFDHRFGLTTISIAAPQMTGRIRAFRRPEPFKQDDYLSLKEKVDNNEFSNQKALIIGGSRGLGEVAAKLLAAGGADVRITYYHGREEAQSIVDDIATHGGVADCFQFNVLNPVIDSNFISTEQWAPTHLYYFATPFIFSGSKGKFSADLFRQFSDYYVVGFSNVFSQLKDFGITGVLYPSSVAIDELPIDMGEYAAAKIAGELLCDFLEKSNKDVAIYKSRFPRAATDQTVSILPVQNEDAATLMINELRAFHSE